MFIKLHDSVDTVVDYRVLLSDCRMGNILICFPQPALAAFVACMLLAGSLRLSVGSYACRVADVMTESPVVVRPTTDMTSAARLLLDTKVALITLICTTILRITGQAQMPGAHHCINKAFTFFSCSLL